MTPVYTFADDAAYLETYQSVIRLQDGRRQVLLCPAYQGRVMTSTAAGEGAEGFGYMNRAVIAATTPQPHMHAYGGEERFWLGPQGGPFSLFFRPGEPQTFDHWATPAPVDTEPFAVEAVSATGARFATETTLTNYAGYTFRIGIDRSVRLLTPAELASRLGDEATAGLDWVAYETDNVLTNRGHDTWQPQTGLLSIWLLGMFKATDRTVAMLPVRRPPTVTQYFTKELGWLTDDDLHGLPGAVLYRVNGDRCGKIGLPADVATNWMGSYNPDRQALTLIYFSTPATPADYVNSLWDVTADPYQGDVVNVYNDGTLARQPTGAATFYELESSSPAQALSPGAALRHTQQTIHLTGPTARLNPLCERFLGVSLAQVTAFSERTTVV